MSHFRTRAAAALLALAWAASPRVAVAADRCGVIDGGGPELEHADASTRLAFLRETMADQASRAHTWTWAWSGIGVGLAAAQYALVPANPPEHREEQAFQASTSFFIPLAIAVLPLHTGRYRDELEEMVARASTPHGTMTPCLVLSRAEELVEAAAEDEASHTSVVQHVLAFVEAGAYAGILAALYKWVPGTLTGGLGALAIGEGQILTSPRGAIHALERYRRGDIGSPHAPAVSWSLAPSPNGVGAAIVGTF